MNARPKCTYDLRTFGNMSKKITLSKGLKHAKEARFELRLPEDLKNRATRAATAEGRTLAGWVRHLIEQNC
jgi:predicted HicB family RNase H-like nuclease